MVELGKSKLELQRPSTTRKVTLKAQMFRKHSDTQQILINYQYVVNSTHPRTDLTQATPAQPEPESIMGLSLSRHQPVYPLPNPAFNPNSNAYGYQPFGFFNPNQGGRKKDRVSGYGMYPPTGYGYPVYPSYRASTYPVAC